MADLGTGAKCMKYTLFVFNILILLGGLILIIIGAIAQAKASKAQYYDGGVAIAIIVIGCIIFLVSSFGCFGAINNNSCMLITYGVILLLMLLTGIGIVIAAGVLSSEGKLTQILNTYLTPLMNTYGNNSGYDNVIIDDLQSAAQCCGTTGPLSWNPTNFTKTSNSLPDSCCVNDTHNCGFGKYPQANNSALFYQQGCIHGLWVYLHAVAVVAIIILVVVVVVMVTGMSFAFSLASTLRKDYAMVCETLSCITLCKIIKLPGTC